VTHSKNQLFLCRHKRRVRDQPTLDQWEEGLFEVNTGDSYYRCVVQWSDKGTLMPIGSSGEATLKNHLLPSQTIYLAFGHDEEVVV